MTSIGSLSVDLELDRSKFDSDLTNLERTKVEPIPVELKIDSASLKKQVQSLNLSSVLNLSGSFGAEDALKDLNKKMQGQIDSALKSSLKNLTDVVTAPFKKIFTGAFEGIGTSITNSFANKAVASFENQMGASLSNLGDTFGKFLGSKFQKINTGSSPTVSAPPAPTPAPEKTKLKLLTQGGILRTESGGIDALEAKSQISSARLKIEQRLTALQQSGKATSKEFNDLLKKTAEIRERIAKDIANESLPDEVKRSLVSLNNTKSKLANLELKLKGELFKTQRTTQKAGFESLSIPLSRVGTGQAGLATSQAELAQTNFARIFSEIARLSGVSKAVLPQLKFDRQMAAGDGLYNRKDNSVTLSGTAQRELQAGKLSEEVFKAIAHELRHALQLRSGKLSEFDIAKGAKAGVSLSSGKPDDMRAVVASVSEFRKKYEEVFGKKLPKDIEKAIKSLEKDAKAFEEIAFKKLAPRLSEILGSNPKVKIKPINDPSAPSKVSPIFSESELGNSERFWRGLEAKFYRRFARLTPQMDGKERRSMVSEATGFFASGAILANPAASAAALLPMLTPLIPMIAAGGMAANFLAPIVSTISQTLQRLEPIQKRFEVSAGSKEGATSEMKFVRGISDNLNVPLVASLEQFSKLSIAAEKTTLEGEKIKELFEAIAITSKSLKFNQQDINGVMFAFTQMLSKGKISAEEVRLQLAEKLPGAIGLFARALKVSVPEFNAMLESGALMSEEVLPKLAKQMKEEFGGAAQEAGISFTSSLVKVENAIFGIQEGFANAYGPAMAMFTNLFADILQMAAVNSKALVTVFGTFTIGLVATVMTGLNVILTGSGVTQKLTAFLIPVLGRVFATLTPFAAGIFSDFLDEIFGAQASVMENMMQGSFNIVYGMIRLIEDLTGSTTKVIDTGIKASGLPGFVDILLGIRKMIPSVLVEYAALFLMLAQTAALVKLALAPMFIHLWATIQAVGASFLASARSGGVFNSAMGTLKAGLSNTGLMINALLAALILLYAKADFKNELEADFNDFSSRAVENLNKIREAAKNAGDEVKNIPGKKGDRDSDNATGYGNFKSKGFDLTLGLGEQFGEGAFRTDDVIKMIRGTSIGKNAQIITLAEKQFYDNQVRTSNIADAINTSIDESKILSPDFNQSKTGQSLQNIRNIDEQIKQLQLSRVDLLESGDGSAGTTKKAVEIDAQIKKLLSQRETEGKPITSFRDATLENVAISENVKESILKSDYNQAAKDAMIALIEPTLKKAQEAKAKLQELNALDLSPLGKQFSQVKTEIEKSNTALESTFEKLQLDSIKGQTDIKKRIADGSLTKDQAPILVNAQEERLLKRRQEALEDFVEVRKKQLRELLAIPNPNKEQTELIKETRKTVAQKSVELAQTEGQVADNQVQGMELSGAAFEKNTQRQIAYQDALNKQKEAREIILIRRQQQARLLTEQQASEEISKISILNTDRQIASIWNQRKAYHDAFLQGKISATQFHDKERELTVQLSDLKKQKVEQELQLRDQVNQRILADLEFANSQAAGVLQRIGQNRSIAVKERQLGGKLNETQAASQLDTVQEDSAYREIDLNKQKLAQLDALERQGVKTAREVATEKLQIQQQIAGQYLQILDQQLAREKRLRDEANAEAESRVAMDNQQAIRAAKETQLGGGKSERETATALEAIAQRTLSQEIALTREKLQQNISTAERRQLEGQLETQLTQAVEQRLATQKRIREEAADALDDQIRQQQRITEEQQNHLDLQGREYDYWLKVDDQLKSILESRRNLSKAMSDAKVASGETALEPIKRAEELFGRLLSEDGLLNKAGSSLASKATANLKDVIVSQIRAAGVAVDPEQLRSLVAQSKESGSAGEAAKAKLAEFELAILDRRQALESQIAAAKAEAIKAEQQHARMMLEIDLRRTDMQARQAYFAAKKADLEARAAVQAAEGERKKAERIEDPRQKDRALADADSKLKIAQEGLGLSRDNLALQEGSLNQQAELFDNARKTLSVQQQMERSQFGASEAARQNAAQLERAERASKRLAENAAAQAGYTVRVGSQEWEQQRQARNDFSNSINAPGDQKSNLIQAAMSMKDNPFFSMMLQQNGMGDIAQLAGQLRDVNPMRVQATMASAKIGNKDVVEELRKLNENISGMASRPTNLNVSTASPVRDAASIYGDLSKQSVRGANL
ncbi:tape measure protein [Coleofasciculus sp. FACHB-T130]|uniref:tape measure protein n=1 Tax=Cyanophyceae TaxID=3028117 RepID=UPI001687DF5C|nr:tape measure protein [Coleofasciculus sp. FACHB-T130]MBD1879069.1 tape measure protein [Coleofasciculus sp. FACHB-T130]